jgi:TatD DNase family protein
VIEYFDSHCHLTDAAFRDDREAVFHRAHEVGVTRLVSIASNLDDARAAVALVEQHQPGGRRDDPIDGSAAPPPRLWCTAGVHPHEVGDAAPGDLAEIEALARAHDSVVAIGETGLDYFCDNAPRERQRASFDAHLALGAELGLPVVVHAREADDDISAALRAMPSGTAGVLHCFTGGPKGFAAAVEAGWYVSFSGIASFKSFEPVDLMREVPDDRLLIETDAPYLSPVPKRGRRNEPAHLIHVAAAVAAHLGVEPGDVARRSTENACRFYGVA